MSNFNLQKGFVYKNGANSAANPQNERLVRLARSLTQKMLLLNVDSGSNKRWNFVIQGQSNEKYTVNLSENLNCTCDDFKNGDNGRLCKHILYVIAKLAKKRQLLNLHIRSTQLKKQHFQEIIVELDKNLAFRIHGKGQEQYKDACQICFDQMKSGGKGQCRNCKQNFHEQCLNEWKAYSTKCPVCNQNMGFSSQVKQEAVGRIYLLSLSRKQVRQVVQWEFYLSENLSFNRTVFVHENSIECNCKEFQRGKKPCKHVKFVIINLATFPKMLAYVENPQNITKKSIRILDRYLIDNFNQFLTKGLGIKFSKSAQKYKPQDQRNDNIGKCKVCFESMNFMKQDRVSNEHLSLCSTSGNAFHEQCITVWRRKHNSDSCPICRKEVYDIQISRHRIEAEKNQSEAKQKELLQKNKGPKQMRLHGLNIRNAAISEKVPQTQHNLLSVSSKSKKQQINEGNRNKRQKKFQKLIEKQIEKRKRQGKLIFSSEKQQKQDKLTVRVQESHTENLCSGTPTGTPQGTPTSNILEGCDGIEIINTESVHSTPRFNTIEETGFYIEDFQIHMKNKKVNAINRRNLNDTSNQKDPKTTIDLSAQKNVQIQEKQFLNQASKEKKKTQSNIKLVNQSQQASQAKESARNLMTKKKLSSRLENYLISKQGFSKKASDNSTKSNQTQKQKKSCFQDSNQNSQYCSKQKEALAHLQKVNQRSEIKPIQKLARETSPETDQNQVNQTNKNQETTPSKDTKEKEINTNLSIDQNAVQQILMKTIEECSKSQNPNHQFIYQKLNENLEKFYQQQTSLSKQQMEAKKKYTIKILEKTIDIMKNRQQNKNVHKNKEEKKVQQKKLGREKSEKGLIIDHLKQKNGTIQINQKPSDGKQTISLASQIIQSQKKIMSGCQSKISERERKQSHVKIQVFDIDSQSSDLEDLMMKK